MKFVLTNAWPLLLGMLLLMLGNGMQSSLLAVRGNIEAVDAATMSVVMSGYFVGFLFGSRMAPRLIRRVGHVRVFAAMGSLISAAFILYGALPDPWVWTGLRVLVGLGFSCVYVVAESWLNGVSTNETRGQALSAYLIVQMTGIILAQVLLAYGDPSGYMLFVLISVLVSVSFLPILLSVNAAPVQDVSKPMTILELYRASPLGCVSAFVLGAVFAAQFGMAPVYATETGLPLDDLATFVSSIYVGGLVAQYPLGWLSDRMNRRRLMMIAAALGGAVILGGALFAGAFPVLLFLGFAMGAISNPLYSLILAYVNDYLPSKDMPAASSGIIFLNGVGAILGPIPVGWLMNRFGPAAFFVFIGLMLLFIAGFAALRTLQNPVRSVTQETAFAPVSPQFTSVATDISQDFAEEQASESVENSGKAGAGGH